MIRHIENLDIEQFIQVYLGTFSIIHPCLGLSRDINAYWGIFRHYWEILCHIQTSRTLCNPCLYNRVIFRTLVYLEPEAFSKSCQTFKMIRYIQSPGIVRTVYSSIFKDIFGYPEILMHIQPPLGIILFAKRFIFNVWQCSECTSVSIIEQ